MRFTLVLLLILGLAVAAGCGVSGDKKTLLSAEPVEPFSSPYCVTARNWAVHELNGDGDDKAADPAAFKAYWSEYLDYRETALEQSPPSLSDENAILVGFLRTRLTPVLEKYGFDVSRIEREGTRAEKSVGEPPPRAQKAQDATHVYDNMVCGYGGSPPPADVTFMKTPAAKPYCAAVAAQEEGFRKVASSGFTPESLKSYVTSDEFSQVLDAQDANAPAEIEADVKTDNAWARGQKLKLLEKFDYDLRRLMLDGSAEELAAFYYWDPRIIEQDSRVAAFWQQVCGIE